MERIHRPSPATWSAEIEAIRGAIHAGRFAKIVAAQCSRAVFDAPLDVALILERLARSRDASTRFAFRGERGTFLGSTPERLVSLRGRRFETEALAGSSPNGSEHTARLLKSTKDLHEHRLVVEAIAERLEPLSRELDVSGRPRVRTLRNVSHLRTPIAGVLDRPRHVLELAEALYPTPAVGGVPTAGSRRWIRERESPSRGWYAAPVGWFDATGDGDFAVALRSAMVRGREAHVFAGAGIVADSDPELEYAETELKRQALLTALGA